MAGQKFHLANSHFRCVVSRRGRRGSVGVRATESHPSESVEFAYAWGLLPRSPRRAWWVIRGVRANGVSSPSNVNDPPFLARNDSPLVGQHAVRECDARRECEVRGVRLMMAWDHLDCISHRPTCGCTIVGGDFFTRRNGWTLQESAIDIGGAKKQSSVAKSGRRLEVDSIEEATYAQ